jgi:hypothetical protein
MAVATEPKSPRINVEVLTEEERRMMHEARVVAAALGEPLRDLVLRALRNELHRQRRSTPDLLEALDRLRQNGVSSRHAPQAQAAPAQAAQAGAAGGGE